MLKNFNCAMRLRGRKKIKDCNTELGEEQNLMEMFMKWICSCKDRNNDVISVALAWLTSNLGMRYQAFEITNGEIGQYAEEKRIKTQFLEWDNKMEIPTGVSQRDLDTRIQYLFKDANNMLCFEKQQLCKNWSMEYTAEGNEMAFLLNNQQQIEPETHAFNVKALDSLAKKTLPIIGLKSNL